MLRGKAHQKNASLAANAGLRNIAPTCVPGGTPDWETLLEMLSAMGAQRGMQ